MCHTHTLDQHHCLALTRAQLTERSGKLVIAVGVLGRFRFDDTRHYSVDHPHRGSLSDSVHVASRILDYGNSIPGLPRSSERLGCRLAAHFGAIAGDDSASHKRFSFYEELLERCVIKQPQPPAYLLMHTGGDLHHTKYRISLGQLN